MNWIKAKSLKDIPEETRKILRADFTKGDGVLSVEIIGKLLIRKYAYGDAVELYVPAPPEKETRYTVAGEIKTDEGITLSEINKTFETRGEADNYLSNLRLAIPAMNGDVKVQPVEVECDLPF